jgi:hypothetical protein
MNDNKLINFYDKFKDKKDEDNYNKKPSGYENHYILNNSHILAIGATGSGKTNSLINYIFKSNVVPRQNFFFSTLFTPWFFGALKRFDVLKIEVFIIKNNNNLKEKKFKKDLSLTNNNFEIYNLIKRNMYALNIVEAIMFLR